MWKYIAESIGIRIFFGIVVVIAINIVVLLSKERNIKHSIANSNLSLERRYESITTFRRLLTGALVGFVLSFTLVMLYSILRFGRINIFTEMGALYIGFIGIIIGSLFGIIRFKRKS